MRIIKVALAPLALNLRPGSTLIIFSPSASTDSSSGEILNASNEIITVASKGIKSHAQRISAMLKIFLRAISSVFKFVIESSGNPFRKRTENRKNKKDNKEIFAKEIARLESI
jgi:hypothetical protein